MRKAGQEWRVDLRALATGIVRRLREAGFNAFFVGGCVRDQLLGRVPQDFDIATDARAEDIERLFAKTIPVGRQFGVMIVVENGQQFQVATFRAESDYADGRRPGKAALTACMFVPSRTTRATLASAATCASGWPTKSMQSADRHTWWMTRRQRPTSCGSCCPNPTPRQPFVGSTNCSTVCSLPNCWQQPASPATITPRW